MKRNINFLLVATGIVAITACGNSTNSNSGESDSIQQDSVTLSSTNAEKNNKLVIKIELNNNLLSSPFIVFSLSPYSFSILALTLAMALLVNANINASL